jgi:hypothetical protein
MVVFYLKMYFQGDKEYKMKLSSGARSKKVFCALIVIINLGLACFFFGHSWMKTSIISKYLLVIFGLNMAIYFFYYLFMKYYYVLKFQYKHESLTWICWAYCILAITFSFVGLHFFTSLERSSRISPAESRELNEECTLYFFDKHDIWHFASSFGLLFTFMTLLTTEDNNTARPWRRIPVF